jgi:hypothetical protein
MLLDSGDRRKLTGLQRRMQLCEWSLRRVHACIVTASPRRAARTLSRKSRLGKRSCIRVCRAGACADDGRVIRRSAQHWGAPQLQDCEASDNDAKFTRESDGLS